MNPVADAVIRVVRDLRIMLPSEDPPEEFEEFIRLPVPGHLVTEARITGDTWHRAIIENLKLTRSWLKGANLAPTTIVGAEIERCVFSGCTMIGANWGGIILKNVIFEHCRLDYATLSEVKTVGPVAFLGCSLAETTLDHCTLKTAVFDGCKLTGLKLTQSNLKDADLRGNDVSVVATPTGLRGAVISQSQLLGLLDALVKELGITLKAELPIGEQPR